MMLRDGTCVCNASQNLFKDTSSLEHAILNSVKFGASMGYLPSNCQFFNLKVSGDNFKDQWQQRNILVFSSLHTHLPSAAGFPQLSYIYILISTSYIYVLMGRSYIYHPQMVTQT